MWLFDRSRYLEGLQHCSFSRYMQYHWNGTGIRRVTKSIPLETGTYVHQALENVFSGVMCGQTSDKMFDTYVSQAQEAFRSSVKGTGFVDMTSEDSRMIVEEQAFLIGALAHGYIKYSLPTILEKFEVVAVEDEHDFIIACDCKLGRDKGTIKEHQAKGCGGIGLMTRPDIILRRKSDGTIGMHDFKTAGRIDVKWQREWNNSVQMALQSLGAERTLGEPISHFYIHALVKGDRVADKYAPEKPRTQNSPLCYGYYNAGNPPLQPEEWASSSEYVDAGGLTRKRTAKGGWNRVPLWGMWRTRDWIEHTSPDLADLFQLFGPYQRPDFLIEELLQEVAFHEEGWRLGVNLCEHDEESFSTDAVQNNLRANFPRSWNCNNRYGDACQFKPICFKEDGWKTPLQSGLFEKRNPHHEQEGK